MSGILFFQFCQLWARYLSDRTQYVCYKNCNSEILDLICGVLQGSILGPLLFILYINDIVNSSNMLQFILFADDTTSLFSDKDISSKVDLTNTELKEVTNWFKTNKLSVNASKTNFMIIGTTHQTYKPENGIKVILDSVELSRVNENLAWKVHIDAISKTISRNVGMIKAQLGICSDGFDSVRQPCPSVFVGHVLISCRTQLKRL